MIGNRSETSAARTGRGHDRLANDRAVDWTLRIASMIVLAVIVAMVGFVFKEAWPSFAHNGFNWFGSPGAAGVDQQMNDIFNSPADRPHYEIGAWPIIYATLLTTAGAVVLGTLFATMSAIFIVEFAPPRLGSLLTSTVRLLAAVPSVIYGLIGLLILVPFVADNLITDSAKESVAYVVQLNGSGLLVALIVLTVMITPIMIAIIADALRTVPRSWIEGSTALGVNRWRTAIKISVRAARPAIVAAAVLASGRAIGEAIALSMVSGSVGFAPNPLDGPLFFLEPLRPLAATIVDNAEGLSVKSFGETMYAFAAVLLASSMFLSIGGFLAKLPMKKYTTRG